MEKLQVKSLPLKEVIQDLADAMGTDYTETCNLYTVALPKSYGTGYVEGIDFGNGFGMLNYDCTFSKDVCVSFTLNQVHPVKFMHCYGGDFDHQFADETIKHYIEQYKNVIVASTKYNGHLLYFRKGVPVQICSIEIDRKNFLPKVECLSREEEDDIVRLIKDIDALKTFYHEGNYSLAISHVIQDIVNFERFPLLESLHYEGKSYEILVHQWAQYHDDAIHGGDNSLLRRADIEAFKKMEQFVSDNIDKPLTVDLLEVEFGMSEKKLQELFKEIQRTTVNSYIQEKRLERAVNLMKTTKYNISEIVYAVGLSSKSYFSKVFKQKYGISPSHYARKLKEVAD